MAGVSSVIPVGSRRPCASRAVPTLWPEGKRCLLSRVDVSPGPGRGSEPHLIASDMQQHECAMSWKAHCGEVYSVEFSYDENTVYSIGEDGKVGGSRILLGNSSSSGLGIGDSREHQDSMRG